MSSNEQTTRRFAIVDPDTVKDHYEGSDVPGEFRSLTSALGADQIAMSLIRVPPHSDFEQGTGHFHDEIEEVYIIASGVLTMKFDDETKRVKAPAAVRISPKTRHSHRNEGDEPVDIWAISQNRGNQDATKIDDFWEASPQAAQHR